MSKAAANFRQLDVSRAIKAARAGGLDVESVVIDTALKQITVKAKPRGKRDPDGHRNDTPPGDSESS